MNYLKIIFYGILSFIERNPIFCLFLLIVAIVAPILFKVFLYVILGLLLFAVIGIAIAVWRMRKMQRQMNEQFRNMGSQQGFGGAGFGGAQGFGGFSSMGGMSLEELVRQMQAQADARQQANRTGGSASAGATSSTTTASGQPRKRVSDDVGDYVDFEEVKDKR